MKLTITNCPNVPEVRTALEPLRPTDHEQRRRGRGCRHARFPNDDRYWQSLPLPLAERFTLYIEPKERLYNYWREPFQRFDFIGLEPSGKPRIRVLLPEVKP